MIVDTTSNTKVQSNNTPSASASSSSRTSPRPIPANRIQELPDTDSEDLMMEDVDEVDPDAYIVEGSYQNSRQSRSDYNETQVVHHNHNTRSNTNNIARTGHSSRQQPQSPPPRYSSASHQSQRSHQVVAYPSHHRAFDDPTYDYASYGPRIPHQQPMWPDDDDVYKLRGERNKLSQLMRGLNEQEDRFRRYTSIHTSDGHYNYQQPPPPTSPTEEPLIITNAAARTRYRSAKLRNVNVGGSRRNVSPSRPIEPRSPTDSNNSTGYGKPASKMSRPGPFG